MWKELLKRLLTKPKYEYMVFEHRKGGSVGDLTDKLGTFGKDGWDVSVIIENTHINFKAILKREV